MHLRSGRGDPRGPFAGQALEWTLGHFLRQMLLCPGDTLRRRVLWFSLVNRACSKIIKRTLVSEAQLFRAAGKLPRVGSLTHIAMRECCENLHYNIKRLNTDAPRNSILEWKLDEIEGAIDAFTGFEIGWEPVWTWYPHVHPNEHMIVDKTHELFSAFDTAPWLLAYAPCTVPVKSAGWQRKSIEFRNFDYEYEPLSYLAQLRILQSDIAARRLAIRKLRRKPTKKRAKVRGDDCVLM